MTVYKNKKPESPLASVEFSPVSEGNFSFFTVTPGHEEAIKKWLVSPEIEQEIIAETQVDGKHVFVTHGNHSQTEILKLLEAQGNSFDMQIPKKPFNYWAARGSLSMVGQVLQLTSGFLAKGAPDGATITFALCNIAANISNMIFGAQKAEDINRLRFLKTQVNDSLAPHLDAGDALPGIDDNRSNRRKPPEAPQSLSEQSREVMEKNSVRIGEIGLRYLGSLAMAFPLKKGLVEGSIAAVKGDPVKGYRMARNPDNWTRSAGLAYMFGKTLGFASKTPDPYDPKPHTWVDTLREKYIFKTSTVIEAAAAAGITYDRFAHRPIKFPKTKLLPQSLRGKESRDYFGGIGGALFVAAFAMRFFADFGVKKLNMEELEAHISDAIAQTPPDKLPQLMAETAAIVKNNFKDKGPGYGEIFTQMMSDLYRYHHIALDNLGTEPEERLAEHTAKVTPHKVLINQPGQQVEAAKKILSKSAGALASHSQRLQAQSETPGPALGA